MDARTFFNLVAQMREAQKTYFRTRSQSSLTESKRIETMVDREIKRVKNILEEQKPEEAKLF